MRSTKRETDKKRYESEEEREWREKEKEREQRERENFSFPIVIVLFFPFKPFLQRYNKTMFFVNIVFGFRTLTSPFA